MAEHVLEPTAVADAAGGAYSCSVCGLSFRLHPPQWLRECPGVPVYPYEQIPAYLATATQLTRDGFRSGSGPAGCYIAYQRQKVVYLFDRGQALSLREPGVPRVQQRATPARATLARATVELQALRTCASCGRLVPSKYDLYDSGRAGRLCSSCYDRWAYEQDEDEAY
jgi:hypothetical protein